MITTDGWRNITHNSTAMALAARWAQRDRTRQPITMDDITGPKWTHLGFYVAGEMVYSISVEERRPYGYELHAEAAPGTSPNIVRRSTLTILDALLQDPQARVVAWVNDSNRAARRLSSVFLEKEITLKTGQGLMVRFSMTPDRWQERRARLDCASQEVKS